MERLTFSNALTRMWLRLAVAFVAFLVPIYLFVQLADEVQASEALPFDLMALHIINRLSSDFLDTLTVVLTQFGGFIAVTVITVGLASLLWGRRKRQHMVMLLSGVGGAALLNLFLKAFFQRDRPELWERLVVENSYSFPSGHAMASSALAFSLMVIFWSTKWRWHVVVFATLYMLVIGFTRLYLGVHYPTDIVAGWAVSAAWVVTVAAAIRLRKRMKRNTNHS